MESKRYTHTYYTHSRVRVLGLWRGQLEQDWYAPRVTPFDRNSPFFQGEPSFLDFKMGSEGEAVDHLLANHKPNDVPLAISFYLPRKMRKCDIEKLNILKTRRRRLEAARILLGRRVLESFLTNCNRLRVRCVKCASLLNRKLLLSPKARSRIREHGLTETNSPRCPLCSTLLLSVASQGRLRRADECLAQTRAKIELAEIPPPSKKLGWVVGGNR